MINFSNSCCWLLFAVKIQYGGPEPSTTATIHLKAQNPFHMKTFIPMVHIQYISQDRETCRGQIQWVKNVHIFQNETWIPWCTDHFSPRLQQAQKNRFNGQIYFSQFLLYLLHSAIIPTTYTVKHFNLFNPHETGTRKPLIMWKTRFLILHVQPSAAIVSYVWPRRLGLLTPQHGDTLAAPRDGELWTMNVQLYHSKWYSI